MHVNAASFNRLLLRSKICLDRFVLSTSDELSPAWLLTLTESDCTVVLQQKCDNATLIIFISTTTTTTTTRSAVLGTSCYSVKLRYLLCTNSQTRASVKPPSLAALQTYSPSSDSVTLLYTHKEQASLFAKTIL